MWFLEKLLIIIILYKSNQKYYDISSKYNTSSTFYSTFFPTDDAKYLELYMTYCDVCHSSTCVMCLMCECGTIEKRVKCGRDQKRDILAFGFRRFFSKFQLSKSHIKNNSKSFLWFLYSRSNYNHI